MYFLIVKSNSIFEIHLLNVSSLYIFDQKDKGYRLVYKLYSKKYIKHFSF